jgi:hypothetical protein
VTNNRITATKVIQAQKNISKELTLPLAENKAQLTIIYPRNYRGQKIKKGTYICNIRVTKSIKVLGLTI